MLCGGKYEAKKLFYEVKIFFITECYIISPIKREKFKAKK